LVPAPDGGDDFVWVLCPLEGPWVVVGLGEVALDGSLQGDQRMEDTALQALLVSLAKNPSMALSHDAEVGVKCGNPD
jgi:hypothetical protein